jgi:phage-related protein
MLWLHGEIRTPPFSTRGRLTAGELLRRLRRGDKLEVPESRPMPSIGARCHELRINDGDVTWRIVYRLDVDVDAVVILEVFRKKTRATPAKVLQVCRNRLKAYDSESE